MATYQIHINERQALGKSIVTLLKSVLNLVSFEPITVNKGIHKKKLTPFEKSLEDIKHGRISRVKNISNLLEECMQ